MPSSSTDVRTTPGKQSEIRLQLSDRETRHTARCVIDRAQGQVTKLLDTVPESNTESHIFNAMHSRMTWCYPGSGGIRFTAMIWRGFLAEHLIAGMDSDAKTEAVTNPLEDAGWVSDFGDMTGENKGLIGLPQFGRCVVAADPAAVLALVAAESFSSEENSVMGKIVPLLPPCMDSGITGEFSKQSLRAVLAEGLYHYLLASGVAVGAKKG